MAMVTSSSSGMQRLQPPTHNRRGPTCARRQAVQALIGVTSSTACRIAGPRKSSHAAAHPPVPLLPPALAGSLLLRFEACCSFSAASPSATEPATPLGALHQPASPEVAAPLDPVSPPVAPSPLPPGPPARAPCPFFAAAPRGAGGWDIEDEVLCGSPSAERGHSPDPDGHTAMEAAARRCCDSPAVALRRCSGGSQPGGDGDDDDGNEGDPFCMPTPGRLLIASPSMRSSMTSGDGTTQQPASPGMRALRAAAAELAAPLFLPPLAPGPGRPRTAPGHASAGSATPPAAARRAPSGRLLAARGSMVGPLRTCSPLAAASLPWRGHEPSLVGWAAGEPLSHSVDVCVLDLTTPRGSREEATRVRGPGPASDGSSTTGEGEDEGEGDLFGMPTALMPGDGSPAGTAVVPPPTSLGCEDDAASPGPGSDAAATAVMASPRLVHGEAGLPESSSSSSCVMGEADGEEAQGRTFWRGLLLGSAFAAEAGLVDAADPRLTRASVAQLQQLWTSLLASMAAAVEARFAAEAVAGAAAEELAAERLCVAGVADGEATQQAAGAVAPAGAAEQEQLQGCGQQARSAPPGPASAAEAVDEGAAEASSSSSTVQVSEQGAQPL